MTKLYRALGIGLISAAVLTASAPAFARDLSPAGHTFTYADANQNGVSDQEEFKARIVAEGEAFEARVLAEQMSAVAGSQSQLDFERPEGLDGYTSPGEDGGSMNKEDVITVLDTYIIAFTNYILTGQNSYCDLDGCVWY